MFLRVSLQLRALQYMSTMRRSKSELLMYLSVLVPVFNERSTSSIEQIANICYLYRSHLKSFVLMMVQTMGASMFCEKVNCAVPRVCVLFNFGGILVRPQQCRQGLDLSRGSFVAFLDADLQNDPADIPQNAYSSD